MDYPEKIELVLTYKHDPEDTEIFAERVDAEKVGDYYRLIHVPAFAPNIAYGDNDRIFRSAWLRCKLSYSRQLFSY